MDLQEKGKNILIKDKVLKIENCFLILKEFHT